MNAKNTLKMIDQRLADARAWYPTDAAARAQAFISLLAADFKIHGEPVGDRLADLVATDVGAAS